MCVYSNMVINPKYKKNKKNGGQPPPLGDRRVKYVPIGCGNCMECRKQKARDWMVRLLEDIKTNGGGKMVTFTFSHESIAELLEKWVKKKVGEDWVYKVKTRIGKKRPVYEIFQIKELKGYERDNAIATKAMRLFNERWRKEEEVAIRHWMVTELGHKGTENIHLHGIIWPNLIGKWEDNWKKVEKIWKYGFIWKGYWKNGKLENYVNQETVVYTTKYVSKIDSKHKEYKAIVLTSDGIGSNYVNTQAAVKNERYQSETYKTTTGHEIALPIYWRNKLFSEEDRERLWIKRLDKEERWVDGVKYDISEGEDNYNKAVMTARKKNNALGYGGRTNENRKEHEEARRDIMIETRIKNTNRMKKKQNKQGMA